MFLDGYVLSVKLKWSTVFLFIIGAGLPVWVCLAVLWWIS